jgi:hypothetical protein
MATVVGYEPMTASEGFVLPILSLVSNPDGRVAQILDEIDSRVTGFGPVETSENFVTFSTGANVSVGSDPVMMFKLSAHEALCGTLAELEIPLLSYANDQSKSAAIRFQIFDLLGDQENKLRMRLAMTNQISKALGEPAAQLFNHSALRTELWRILVARAATREVKLKVLETRGRLFAFYDSGELKLDISALSENDFPNIEMDEIRDELNALFTGAKSTSAVPAGAPPYEGEQTLSGIARVKRQEERVAILLTLILYNPDDAREILEKYPVRTVFERRAIQTLHTHLLNHDFSRRLRWDQLVELMARHIYGLVFPQNKGIYLMALAKHLGHRDEIARYVASRTLTSNAIAIGQYADEIREILSN